MIEIATARSFNGLAKLRVTHAWAVRSARILVVRIWVAGALRIAIFLHESSMLIRAFRCGCIQRIRLRAECR